MTVTAPTEAQILRLLAMRHPADRGWLFLEHVADDIGFSKSNRTLDALALQLWPSRGQHLHGFEVKARRGDWLRELRQPEKADDWAQHCHSFWLVAPAGVVVLDEVPAPWGLLTVEGKKFQVSRPAPLREAPPLPWAVLGTLLRGVGKSYKDAVPRAQVASLVREAREEADVRVGRQQLLDTGEVGKDLAALRTRLETFEAASGIAIDEWDAGEVGAAVKTLRADQQALEHARDQLDYLRRTASGVARQIEQELKRPDRARSKT